MAPAFFAADHNVELVCLCKHFFFVQIEPKDMKNIAPTMWRCWCQTQQQILSTWGMYDCSQKHGVFDPLLSTKVCGLLWVYLLD